MAGRSRGGDRAGGRALLRQILLFAALAGAAVLASGCTAPQSPAAAPPDGVREVTIEAREFAFAPAELKLKAGKVTFNVSNGGAAFHEFLLYPQWAAKEVLEAHRKAGSGGHEHAHGSSPILVTLPGILGGRSAKSEVVDLKPGIYEVGCFLPGHYEAGMKGIIVVE